MIADRAGLQYVSEYPYAPRALVDDLRARWRRASVDEVWRRESDWYTPAVDALVEALSEGNDPVPPATRLASARGQAGVGITETLDDLACLWSAHCGERPPWFVLRAVATGWASGAAHNPSGHEESASAGALAPISDARCLDPLSGLVTPDYFAVRLRESYGRSRRTGIALSTTHCLVVVDVALDVAIPGQDAVVPAQGPAGAGVPGAGWTATAGPDWSQLGKVGALGLAIEATFGEGAPAANLGGGVAVALTTRGSSLGPALRRLRTELIQHIEDFGVVDAVRHPPRVWIERMPSTHMLALDLLASLRH